MSNVTEGVQATCKEVGDAVLPVQTPPVLDEATKEYNGRVVVSENRYKCGNADTYTNKLNSCLGLTWQYNGGRCVIHLGFYGGDDLSEPVILNGQLTSHGENVLEEVEGKISTHTPTGVIQSFGDSQQEWAPFITELEKKFGKILPVQSDRNEECWSCTVAGGCVILP